MKTQTHNQVATAEKAATIKEQILNQLAIRPWCSYEIQTLCGFSQTITVSRRLTELENEGRVIRTGVIVEYKGMKFDQYAVAKPGTELFNQQVRHRQRNIEWLRQGLNLGYLDKEQYELMKSEL